MEFLSSSVVLLQGMGGIQKHYLVKDQVHIMARTAQISKEKRQSIITLKHEGQSMRKISRTLKVSSSAIAKPSKLYDETGSHEDIQRKGSPRDTSAAEDRFLRVTSHINCSTNKCFTEFKEQTHLNINCLAETT